MCAVYDNATLDQHLIILQLYANTHFTKLFLQRKRPVAFFMGKPGYAFNNSSAFAIRSQGYQRRKQVGAFCGIKLEGL